MARKYKSMLGESLFDEDSFSGLMIMLIYFPLCGGLGYLGYYLGGKYLALVFAIIGAAIVYKFQNAFTKLILGLIFLIFFALCGGAIVLILYVLYKVFESL